MTTKNAILISKDEELFYSSDLIIYETKLFQADS